VNDNPQDKRHGPQSLAEALAQLRNDRHFRPPSGGKKNKPSASPVDFETGPPPRSLADQRRVVTCETCGDMGYVTHNVPVGHPDFGKSFRCPACGGPPDLHLREQRQLARLFEMYWMHDSPKLHQFNLDEFIFMDKALQDGKSTAIVAAQQWAAGDPIDYEMLGSPAPTAAGFAPSHALLLYGAPGMGKTCLAAAAYQDRLGEKAGLAIEYNMLMQALLAQVRDGNDGNVDLALAKVARVPLLFLDDLGNTFLEGMETTGRLRWLFEIVNYRYNYRLPTIITTNLDYLRMCDQFSIKLAERLLEWAVWVNVHGPSLRIVYPEDF